jgi:hypothetical protein
VVDGKLARHPLSTMRIQSKVTRLAHRAGSTGLARHDPPSILGPSGDLVPAQAAGLGQRPRDRKGDGLADLSGY